jgi:GPH family glycoside/pentoside/hexuronide:cation symporter
MKRMVIYMKKVLTVSLTAATFILCAGMLTMAVIYEPEKPELSRFADSADSAQAAQLPLTYYKNPAEHAKISLNFSPYYNGIAPGTPVPEADVRRLLNAISPFCDTIRTFSTTEYEEAYKIAKDDYGMRIIAGAWLTGDAETDAAELDKLIELANNGYADMVLCGSEGIYRGDYNSAYAIKCIRYVKSALTDQSLPVSTSDTSAAWLNNKDLINVADCLVYTDYPYFAGVPAEDGAAAFGGTYGKLKKIAGNKTILCSETAFPDTGGSIGAAEPTPANSVSYFEDIYEWSITNSVEVVFFSAANEAWKSAPDEVEANWGICDGFGAVKPQFWQALWGIVSGTKDGGDL